MQLASVGAGKPAEGRGVFGRATAVRTCVRLAAHGEFMAMEAGCSTILLELISL